MEAEERVVAEEESTDSMAEDKDVDAEEEEEEVDSVEDIDVNADAEQAEEEEEEEEAMAAAVVSVEKSKTAEEERGGIWLLLPLLVLLVLVLVLLLLLLLLGEISESTGCMSPSLSFGANAGLLANRWRRNRPEAGCRHLLIIWRWCPALATSAATSLLPGDATNAEAPLEHSTTAAAVAALLTARRPITCGPRS